MVLIRRVGSRLLRFILAGFFSFFFYPVFAAPPADLELALVTTVSGSPLAVRHAGDGSGRIFIVKRKGVIDIYDGTQLLSTPFLDIHARVRSGGETGLLGLAFHPDFSANRYFYVNYTYWNDSNDNFHTRISRFSVPAVTPNVADDASEHILLEIEQPYGNHNGGDMHFGVDGYLYIGMGDGGDGRDPDDLARKTDNLLGKMLRIDVNGSSPGSAACGLIGNYGVPASNPFVANSGACPEIWSYGLRNPWRWSFDRSTHDLFIGDVGQGEWEEVDFQPASSQGGEYYGWSCMEGTHVMIGSRCDATPRVAPILEYAHSSGSCSITGGYRYRGPILEMNGIYIYGDYCSGIIWFAELQGGSWNASVWDNSGLSISSFGEDEAGNVYVVDLNGGIYRFESLSARNDCSLADETVDGVVQNTGEYVCIASKSIAVEGFTVQSGGSAILRAPVVRFITDQQKQLSIEENASLRIMR